jgi:hypothetical protein
MLNDIQRANPCRICENNTEYGYAGRPVVAVDSRLLLTQPKTGRDCLAARWLADYPAWMGYID